MRKPVNWALGLETDPSLKGRVVGFRQGGEPPNRAMAHKVEVPRPWWTRWWVWVILLFVAGQAAAVFVGSVLRVQQNAKPEVETLGCVSRESFIPVPRIAFDAVMPPLGDCWSAWYTRPYGAAAFLIINEGGRLTVELAFASGSTKLFENITPMQDYFQNEKVTGVRFKNTGPHPVVIQIRLR